ncbi:hypothetical protein AB837_00188 [bacterium AB1]|nr:hypothetical protein AB837_00188 [bacterium AB1]
MNSFINFINHVYDINDNCMDLSNHTSDVQKQNVRKKFLLDLKSLENFYVQRNVKINIYDIHFMKSYYNIIMKCLPALILILSDICMNSKQYFLIVKDEYLLRKKNAQNTNTDCQLDSNIVQNNNNTTQPDENVVENNIVVNNTTKVECVNTDQNTNNNNIEDSNINELEGDEENLDLSSFLNKNIENLGLYEKPSIFSTVVISIPQIIYQVLCIASDKVEDLYIKSGEDAFSILVFLLLREVITTLLAEFETEEEICVFLNEFFFKRMELFYSYSFLYS